MGKSLWYVMTSLYPLAPACAAGVAPEILSPQGQSAEGLRRAEVARRTRRGGGEAPGMSHENFGRFFMRKSWETYRKIHGKHAIIRVAEFLS